MKVASWKNIYIITVHKLISYIKNKTGKYIQTIGDAVQSCRYCVHFHSIFGIPEQTNRKYNSCLSFMFAQLVPGLATDFRDWKNIFFVKTPTTCIPVAQFRPASR